MTGVRVGSGMTGNLIDGSDQLRAESGSESFRIGVRVDLNWGQSRFESGSESFGIGVRVGFLNAGVFRSSAALQGLERRENTHRRIEIEKESDPKSKGV